MTYVVQIEYAGFDHYGFPCRNKGVTRVDARSKSQARQLARTKCIIFNLRKIHIGRAMLSEQQ